MEFEFEDIDAICTSDLYYDLFDGGYLNPEKLLVNDEQIQKVYEAMNIIQEYLSQAESAGVIEIC